MFENKLLLIFIVLFGCLYTNAKPYSLELSQKTGDIDFSNRARCALDSKLPTDSAYILLNNIAPAKSILKLSKIKNKNSEEFTRYGIQVYRYAMMSMIKNIHQKLISSRLPLLPAEKLDKVETPLLKEYVEITRECKFKKSCEKMNDFIKQVWNDSELKAKDWRGRSSFLSEKDFNKNKTIVNNQINCHVLKKQSPFHSGILAAKPTTDSLKEIALITKNESDYEVDCDNYSELDNLEVATYKIGIPALKNRKWKKKGFDYWNSLKLYLSWAFRYSDQMDEYAYPFSNIFRAVQLEDTIMIVSTNCKSINKPECSHERLTLNSLREMTKKNFLSKASHSDILRDVPDGVTQKLLDERVPNLKEDFLDSSKFDQANKWLVNFKENFSKTRSHMKRRLLSSLNKLKMISLKINPEVLIDNQNFLNIEPQRAYALCTEHYYTSHESFSFLKSKLSTLSEIKFLDELVLEQTQGSLGELFEYYKSLSFQLTNICKTWESSNYWSESFEPDKSYLKTWYLDKVYDGKYKSHNIEAENGICDDEVECSRVAIESIVKIYASTQYAYTFLNLKKTIKSPDLLNPYSERVACNIYDPWFKTKSSILSLLWNIGQGAISPLNTGIIYTKASLSPKHVKSFNQLVEDGEIIFNKDYDKEKLMLSLGVDFGPLLGVPCDIVINKDNSNIYDYYRFGGISVGACMKKQKYNLNVKSAGDVGTNKKNGYSGCLRCRLHFDSVIGSIGRFVSRIGSSFFLFRGIVGLVRSLKDPENIPRSWSVNPSYALQTYNRFGGKIPKVCVSRLSKGKRCLKSKCLESLSDSIDRRFIKNIIKMSGSNGEVDINIRGCRDKIKVNYYQKDDGCYVNKILSIPSECEHLLRNKK